MRKTGTYRYVLPCCKKAIDLQLRMCAAVSIPYDLEYEDRIRSYVSPETLERFARIREMIFAYWDPVPILPIRKGDSVVFVAWGNRDKQKGLPPTGWARIESLQNRAWDHLHPRVVRIPALRGCEKKVWFAIHGDIRGVVVRYKDLVRVYMITQEATSPYNAMTGHHRMPRFHEGPEVFEAL